MSDSISSEPWWQTRITEIKSEGFNTEKITIELEKNASQASAILEQYEKMVLLSKKLKEDIEKIPSNLEEEKEDLLKKIQNAENAKKVEGEIISILSTYSPWKIVAKRNKILWETSGKGAYLEEYIRRLDALDSSMNAYISDLLFLFESPEKYNELLKKINDIESRQSERVATLESMATLLSKRGFQIKDFNKMSLEERFDILEELQVLDSKHAELERRIKRTIGRFDMNTAADYNQQRQLLTKTRSGLEFDALIERIKNTEIDYLSRLENINKQFSLWIQDGFKLEMQIPILADELLERESQIGSVSNSIIEYKEIWKRLEAQYAIWPEEEAVTYIEYGVLSQKNNIEEIVIQLESRSGLLEEDVRAKITRWKNKGFELKEIEELNFQNPRMADEKMADLSEIFEQIVEAKHLLESLDLSFINDGKDRELWNDKLTNSIPDKNSLNELMKWISITEKRNLRHRKMLEEEWARFENDPAINIENLNLLEFEKLIIMKENSNSLELNNLNPVISLTNRLIVEIELWVENLKNNGWDIEYLESLLRKNPNSLMKIKPDISKQIQNYSKLVNRLEKLPWQKNTSLAKKVLINLRKPELLNEIKNLVPKYMQILASSTDIEENLEFEFTPWIPNKIITKIVEPKEVPQAELILEDEIKNDLPSISKEESAPLTNDINQEKEERTEIIKEIKTVEYTSSPEDWEIYLTSLKNMLGELGILHNFDLNDAINLNSLSELRKGLAKHVGIQPRDTRVDRLLRILLRVIPLNLPEGITLISLSKLIDKLCFCTNKLNKWTAKRLERRHSNASGKLLDDAKELGIALKRIPSPGFAIPLISDNYDLPSINNFEDLSNIVDSLECNITFSHSNNSIPVMA